MTNTGGPRDPAFDRLLVELGAALGGDLQRGTTGRVFPPESLPRLRELTRLVAELRQQPNNKPLISGAEWEVRRMAIVHRYNEERRRVDATDFCPLCTVCGAPVNGEEELCSERCRARTRPKPDGSGMLMPKEVLAQVHRLADDGDFDGLRALLCDESKQDN
jgi:hypothetical protein